MTTTFQPTNTAHGPFQTTSMLASNVAVDSVEGGKEDTVPPTAAQKLAAGVLEARRNLVDVLMEHRFKERFCSTALRLDSSQNSHSIALEADNSMRSSILQYGRPDSGLVVAPSNSFTSCSSEQQQQQNLEISAPGEDLPGITKEEREYLEHLILQGDVATMEAAQARLQDTTLFPADMGPPNDRKTESCNDDSGDTLATRRTLKRRDSSLQQQLFQIHQEKSLQPSEVIQYLKQNSILQDDSKSEEIANAKRESDQISGGAKKNKAEQPENHTKYDSEASWDPNENEEEGIGAERETAEGDGMETVQNSFMDVDPFKDISSWIDGAQGVEVNDSGIPLIGKSSSSTSSSRTSNNNNSAQETDSEGNGGSTGSRPFRILGTSAEDVSCHPHVLSPPLMESLLAFMPEGLTNSNYWIKYSLVRDGASMWTMMRQIRASSSTVLAIETVDGHVFGAFTNHSWRFSVGWYGGQQAFLWKMRRSRLETTTSILEQAMQESEVQVFPVRPGNVAIQYCSKECLMLGRGEIQGHTPGKYGGKHYGHGIYLDSSLLRGTTSSSETFGNPSLVDDTERGTRFDVSNIEVWTLTPHDNVGEAQQSELSTMFLEGGRQGDNLDVLGILVGGVI